MKKDDQVFEDKGLRIVCDLKSFLYLVGTELAPTPILATLPVSVSILKVAIASVAVW